MVHPPRAYRSPHDVLLQCNRQQRSRGLGDATSDSGGSTRSQGSKGLSSTVSNVINRHTNNNAQIPKSNSAPTGKKKHSNDINSKSQSVPAPVSCCGYGRNASKSERQQVLPSNHHQQRNNRCQPQVSATSNSKRSSCTRLAAKSESCTANGVSSSSSCSSTSHASSQTSQQHHSCGSAQSLSTATTSAADQHSSPLSEPPRRSEAERPPPPGDSSLVQHHHRGGRSRRSGQSSVFSSSTSSDVCCRSSRKSEGRSQHNAAATTAAAAVSSLLPALTGERRTRRCEDGGCGSAISKEGGRQHVGSNHFVTDDVDVSISLLSSFAFLLFWNSNVRY